ncbi:MAG: response regulator, partial [Spirochaetia bacterium]
ISFHTTEHSVGLFRGSDADISVMSVSGLSASLSLSHEVTIRFMEARDADGSEIIITIDEPGGILYAPQGWKITPPDQAGAGSPETRLVPLDTIARRFGLVRVLLTHESGPQSAGHTAQTDNAADSSGAPGFCPITHLPKAEFIRRRLESLAAHTASESWLFLISADSIETINASFGREAGDQALRSVAQVIERVRDVFNHPSGKTVFRYDGPVIAYVCDGSLRDALAVSERLRKEVLEREVFFQKLTASIGMASLTEVAESQKNIRQQIQDLEAIVLSRLRIARQSGGNTVCAASPASERGGLASGTILIVDPDADRLRPLVREFETMGMSVFLAGDGVEAMQIMNQVVPDAVISEVAVPKLDGFELRERLSRASEFSRIPFVLVSHRKNDDLLQRAGALGILHYFKKPVSVSELTGLIQNLITRSGV